jgi:uncharacterized membrane protein YeaQ/YmgE (transglycosylase-associated protein family)
MKNPPEDLLVAKFRGILCDPRSGEAQTCPVRFELSGNGGLEMTIVGLIVLLVIAAIAGSIGQALAGYSLGGCLVSTVVGFFGAFLGLWLARQFGLPEFYTISVGGETFPVIWSIIGSFLLALTVGLLTRGRRRRVRG